MTEMPLRKKQRILASFFCFKNFIGLKHYFTFSVLSRVKNLMVIFWKKNYLREDMQRIGFPADSGIENTYANKRLTSTSPWSMM